MTDEELDLLASSFLDGEATPEEVAMIERDPALLARVEELRVAQSAMRTPVPRPSMRVKEDQLAAALATFDAADGQPTVTAVDGTAVDGTAVAAGAMAEHTGPVIDLRARREQRQAEAAGRLRWLSAVAGVLVFAAGAVFLIGQINNGSDDGEFAGDVPAADTATDSAEAELAPADDGGAEASADSDAGTDEAIASEAMTADAEETFSLEEAEEATAEAADSAADESSAAADEPTIREFAEEGFFGDEPVVTYRAIPTSEELVAQVDLPWRNPESARCADRAELPQGAVVIGYLPIEIPAADGETGSATRVVEALYLTVGGESQVILVDPDTCAVI